MGDDRVTLRDVYDIVEKLDIKISKQLDSTEERLRALEDFRSKQLGILSVLVIFASAIASWIWTKITG